MTKQEEQGAITSINLRTLWILICILGVFAGVVGSWYIQREKTNTLEKKFKETVKLLDEIKDFTRQPRYTLADDEKRMSYFIDKYDKELDRRDRWMRGQDEFKLDTIKTQAELLGTIREIKRLLVDIHDKNKIK